MSESLKPRLAQMQGQRVYQQFIEALRADALSDSLVLLLIKEKRSQKSQCWRSDNHIACSTLAFLAYFSLTVKARNSARLTI
jgi:hypothetical protein